MSARYVDMRPADYVQSPFADVRVCPQNTYSTALTVGEKAALIIAEELDIKGV